MGSAVVHFEIGCQNKERTGQFYASLFDWKIDSVGPADMINTGAGEGICGHISSLGHEPHNFVTVYVQVDDVEAYLEKAEKLGGKTIVPATDVPNAGRFAWLADPEGNYMGLWKPLVTG